MGKFPSKNCRKYKFLNWNFKGDEYSIINQISIQIYTLSNFTIGD